MTYPFLVLCLLLLIPAALIWGLRPDLRRPMAVVAALALPFAFTEFLFYPSYWEPRCLFDLPKKIGFGIEDFLFVSGLGAFTSSVYPFSFFKRLAPLPPVPLPRVSHSTGRSSVSVANRAAVRFRMILPIGVALLLTAILWRLSVPIIWGCVPIMLLIAIFIGVIRPDLMAAAFWGGLLSAIVYFVICLVLGILIPNVFALNWHGEKFSGLFIGGVPLEEITYAFAAGAVAAVFYPFVFKCTFQPIRNTGH